MSVYRFPAVAKLDSLTHKGQLAKIAEELQEVIDAYEYETREQLGIELCDLIHACETLMRMSFDENEVKEFIAKAIEKNARRAYYPTDTGCSIKKPNDVVSAPKHYKGNGKIEAMDALSSMMTDSPVSPAQSYWWGCAFKYLWRWPHKNGIEDLKKCRQCIDYLIEEAK